MGAADLNRYLLNKITVLNITKATFKFLIS